MAEAKVGMPTMRGVQGSLIDYAVGLGGGLIYAISQGLLGSGLIGDLLGAGVAGAMLKGTRGTVVATVLGFQSVMGAVNAGSANAATEAEM